MTEKNPQKGKPGRKPLDGKSVDPQVIEDALAIGKTIEGAASLVDLSAATLKRQFGDSIEKGLNRRNTRLQEVQFNMAVEGKNTTMAIWLGKQWLNQADKQEVKQSVMQTYSPETLGRLRTALQELREDAANDGT